MVNTKVLSFAVIFLFSGLLFDHCERQKKSLQNDFASKYDSLKSEYKYYWKKYLDIREKYLPYRNRSKRLFLQSLQDTSLQLLPNQVVDEYYALRLHEMNVKPYFDSCHWVFLKIDSIG